MGLTDSETEQPPLWELIPLASYQLPSAPTGSNARRGLSSLRRLFRRREPEPEGPVKRDDELHALEHERLDAVAGPIDWHEASRALQAALEQRSAADRAWFIIGPPGGGYDGLLEAWAVQQEASCIPAPAYEVVAGNYQGWLAELPQAGCAWALPRLELCWLRHPAGLDLVRDLFDRLLSDKLDFGLIGCDSWAWAYLRFVVPTQAVRALTFQAFDGARLARWLGALAGAGDDHPRQFRHAQSGNLVLAVDDEDETLVSAELRYLAAQSRGNPAAALRLWRSRLRSEPDEPEAASEDAAEQDEDSQREVETIWVAPAVDFDLPSGLDEPDALVLHALLLHDGLPAEVLEGLLPHGRFRTRALLLQLAAANVVESGPDGSWRVTTFAYPAVRAFLAGRRFLVDDL
jgi:hypothetical protein